MPVTVKIPTPLRAFTGGRSSVPVEGATVGEALEALTRDHPDLARHLRDDQGRLRAFVNVYLGEEDIRFLQKDATPIQDGDVLTIVPAVAGGAPARDRRPAPGGGR